MKYIDGKEMLKVSEIEYECDFCGDKKYSLHPLNDGLWAVCTPCMQIHYELIPRLDKRRSKQLRERTESGEEE